MADNNDVFNRADSLMTRTESSHIGGRRRRAFVATPPVLEDTSPQDAPLRHGVPVMPKLEEVVFSATSAVDDDDLPVLTEVVVPEPTVSEPGAVCLDEALVASLAAELAHAIERQLAIELPTLIEASLLTAKEELRAGISATMQMALRDFLAHRQQLRLPLDEPERDE